MLPKIMPISKLVTLPISQKEVRVYAFKIAEEKTAKLFLKLRTEGGSQHLFQNLLDHFCAVDHFFFFSKGNAEEFAGKLCACSFGMNGCPAVSSGSSGDIHDIVNVSAVCNEEIHRSFCGFEAHRFAFRMVCPLIRKAITATEVAIVANVDTKCFDFVGFYRIRFDFFFIKKTFFFQTLYVR